MEKESMICCQKCGSCAFVEEHHIHPRFMNNMNGEGKKVYLCRSHHQQLHQNIIPFILWSYIQDAGYNFVSYKNKIQCIEAIKKRTVKWVTEKE